MSSVVAIVKTVVGQVVAVSNEGVQRLLIEGDRVFRGEEVLTGTSGMITLELVDGQLLDLGRESRWSDTSGITDAAEIAATEQSIEALQQAITDGADPTLELEATAAGPNSGGAGSGGGGNSYVMLDETAQQLRAETGYVTEGLGFTNQSLNEETAVTAIATALADTPVARDTTAPVVTIDSLLTKDSTPALSGTIDDPTATIIVTIDGKDYPATNNGDGTWTLTDNIVDTLAEGDHNATVRATDPSGNQGTDNGIVSVDLTPPNISVSVPALGTDTTPTITGTTDAPAGSVVTITVTPDSGAEQKLTAIVQPDGSYGIDVPDELDDGNYSVTAEVTDPAGNTGSDNAGGNIDTMANLTVSLDDVNSSNIANAPITGTSDVGEGRTVSLVITDANGKTVAATATTKADGSYDTTADLSTLADGNLVVTATVTDAAGNTANATDNTTLLDTTANLTVSLDDVNSSNVANAPISGTSDVGSGRTVSLVITDANGKTVTATAITKADGSYDTTADLSTLADGNLVVTATVTDAAGNTANATDNTTLLDTTANLTVSLNDVNSSNAAKAPITGTSDVGEGRTVNLLITDTNGKTVTATAITKVDGSYDTTADLSTLADGNLVVTATVTDAAGNSANATDNTTLLDTTANLTVSLDDVNSSNVANAPISGTSDVGSGRTVNLLITDANGKTVTATAITKADGSYDTTADLSALIDGNLVVTATVTDAADNTANATDNTTLLDTTANLTVSLDDVNSSNVANAPITGTSDVGEGRTISLVITDTNGKTVTATAITKADGSYDTTADLSTLADGNLVVTATVTDAAGNSANATDNTTLLDTTANLSVSLDDVNSSNVTNAPISGTSDVGEGRTVNLLITDANGKTVTATAITKADGSYDTTADLSTLADGNLVVSATVTDAAGNSASATDATTLLDTKADIDLAAIGDGNLSADEAKAVELKGTTSNVEQGQTVTLTVTDSANNIATFTATVAADGSFSTVVDLTGAGLIDGAINVRADVSDQAGNPATDNEAAILDTTSPVPTIRLDANITSDDTINAVEAGQQIPINGTVGGDVKAGDTVTLTINGKTFTGKVQATNTFSINVPGSDLAADTNQTIHASITTTDAAGNIGSAATTEGYSVDTTAPTVNVTINNDGTVSFVFSEQVKDFETGDVAVTNGNISNLTSADGGTTWTADLTVKAGVEGEVVVNVADKSYTDMVGNAGSAGSASVLVDTKAPTVNVTINNDGTVSFVFSEQVKDFETGDVAVTNGNISNLTSADGGTTWTADLTVKAGVEGEVVVNVADKSYTDMVGNEGSAGSASLLVDTKAPDSDTTALLINDVTNDNVLNSTEAAGQVTLTGTVTGEFRANDVVTLTINNTDYKANVAADGSWSVDVKGSDLAADADKSIAGSVAASDATGNVGNITADKSYGTTVEVFAKISVDQSLISEKGGELTYTVSLVDQHGNPVSVPSGKSIEVQLSWSGCAAKDDSDSTGRPDSVTIGNGSQTSFKVALVEDQVFESHENLTVTIGAITGADSAFENGVNGVSVSSANTTIYDNDVAVNILSPTPVNIGLSLTTWTKTGNNNNAITKELNKLGTDGNGANANTLESVIKTLQNLSPTGNGDLKIENGQRKHGFGGGEIGTQEFIQELVSKNPGATHSDHHKNVQAGTAVHAHGVIFLQAGQTYMVKAAGDDSLRVVLGDRKNAGQVVDLSWGVDKSTYKTFTFTAQESGLYTFDMYMHNQSGAGMYDVSIANQSTPTENIPFFPSFDAAKAQVLGQNSDFTIGGLIGSESHGHYRIYGFNEGQSDSDIALTEIITTGLAEDAKINVEGIPLGFTLSDDAGNSFTATAGDTTADITSWNTEALKLTPATGVSGTYELKVVIQETDNREFDRSHDIQVRVDSVPTQPNAVAEHMVSLHRSEDDDTAAIALSYQEGSTLTGTGENDTLMAGNGNDTLIGGEGDDILYGSAGADTFKWEAGDIGKDVIADFNLNEDSIDLSGLLQEMQGSDNLDDYLKLIDVNGTATLQINTQGELNSGEADASITLLGHTSNTINIDSLVASEQLKID